jgi:hypothetical protein
MQPTVPAKKMAASRTATTTKCWYTSSNSGLGSLSGRAMPIYKSITQMQACEYFHGVSTTEYTLSLPGELT